MGLRDEFARLGVPDHLLAQVLWEDLANTTYAPQQLIELARRLFPDGVHEQVAIALQPANEPLPIRAMQDRLILFRKSA